MRELVWTEVLFPFVFVVRCFVNATALRKAFLKSIFVLINTNVVRVYVEIKYRIFFISGTISLIESFGPLYTINQIMELISSIPLK